ncbi:unnamed protein product [Scytosiphon promiscuus]
MPKMAAARAAVAVMDRIKEKALLEAGAGDGGDGGLGGSARRPATTTRQALLNICAKQTNMTEPEGVRAVQTFVYALGSVPLITEQEKEELVGLIDEQEKARSAVVSMMAEGGADVGTWAYKPGWGEDFPSVYDNDILRDIGKRSPSVAREVDAVLLSKPESSEFSRRIIEGFGRWVASDSQPGFLRKKVGQSRLVIEAAFSEVSNMLDIEFAVFGRWGPEAGSIIRQTQANQAGAMAARAMGIAKKTVVVPEEDMQLFVDQVLGGFASVLETATPACGIRLVRFDLAIGGGALSAEEVSAVVRARMAQTGLDKKVTAFLTSDTLGVYDKMEKLGDKLDRIGDEFETQAATAADEKMQAAQVFGAMGQMLSAAVERDLMFILAPAQTKPSQETVLGEQGKIALALGAPITLCAFLGQAFDGRPVELASKTLDGDVQLLTQAGVLGLVMVGLLLARDAARWAAAKSVGIELASPLALPSFETGVLARRIDLASYPLNSKDLFDVVLAGPLVGLATSALALVVGLQMTASAGPEALAGFPSLPSSLLQSSSFVGSMVDSFLHTNLAAKDLAAERIAMHPLAVGGAAAMLWNAVTVLPLQGSDGKTVVDTLESKLPAAGTAEFVALCFVGLQILGSGGDFLTSVLLVNFIAFPESAPLMRQDNVTSVRSPPRLLLAFLVAGLSLVVLTPMTVSSFLAAGSTFVDTGAGAESVAAGFGVGGVGFNGFL